MHELSYRFAVDDAMTAEERIEIARAHAKAAGLRYVYDSDPGYARRKRGKGMSYIHPDGKPLKDKTVILRINALAIPPAYSNVWICVHDNGHIQATGFDARGRKQYRYHPEWRAARDDNKFGNMRVFGACLPSLRRKVQAALNLDGLPKDKVIAAIVRLLDKTGLRVGSDAYLAENATCGLTTISKKHVDLHGKEIELDFPAKGGKRYQGSLTDPKVAKVISLCEDLPGYRLFKWVDEDGETRTVSSSDVNEWLQDKTGAAITAKDFRTWTACALFLDEAMETTRCCVDAKELKLKPILKTVSEQLGNTPAILQKSYVHPELIDLYRTGCMLNREWQHDDKDHVPAGYRKTEALLLRWLEKTYP
ncbi:MAG: DNA topoisomerase I [Micavibrio aeruginosavorus]|uniref:DNA topoisomerase n=1 Tax=Micavibrio aeruginosavorus TaxID=349221 RepID=A0A2W5BY49_9BACT|nr:MAG: DNA topoisomerase I [Micavibrio aeruginosavorus]